MRWDRIETSDYSGNVEHPMGSNSRNDAAAPLNPTSWVATPVRASYASLGDNSYGADVVQQQRLPEIQRINTAHRSRQVEKSSRYSNDDQQSRRYRLIAPAPPPPRIHNHHPTFFPTQVSYPMNRQPTPPPQPFFIYPQQKYTEPNFDPGNFLQAPTNIVHHRHPRHNGVSFTPSSSSSQFLTSGFVNNYDQPQTEFLHDGSAPYAPYYTTSNGQSL